MEINLPTPLPSDILVSPTSYPLKINGSQECLSFITGDLLTVFHLGSLTQRFQRSFGRVPILAEVLAKTNIVALVFSSDPYTLSIWDDHQSTVIKEIKSLNPIINVHFIGEFLLVINLQACLLYRIEDFQLINKEVTGNNPLGLGTLQVNRANDYLLAVPAPESGHVIIRQSETRISFQAHQNPLSALTLNNNGTFLATASERGTIIRIWSGSFSESHHTNQPAYQLIQEFRRGAEVTSIQSLIFHPNPELKLLAVTGNTKTSHFFSWDQSESTIKKSIKSKKDRPWWNQAWSIMSREIPKYITSRGSVIQIPSPKNCLMLFHPEQPEIILISPKGLLAKYLYQIDPPETRQILSLQLN